MRDHTSTFLTLALGVTLASAALAHGNGTPDGSPPAEETACEDAGLRGAAYGLCVAYCEASDCDAFPDSEACDRIWENYTKITGEEFFPCEQEEGEDDLS